MHGFVAASVATASSPNRSCTNRVAERTSSASRVVSASDDPVGRSSDNAKCASEQAPKYSTTLPLKVKRPAFSPTHASALSQRQPSVPQLQYDKINGRKHCANSETLKISYWFPYRVPRCLLASAHSDRARFSSFTVRRRIRRPNYKGIRHHLRRGQRLRLDRVHCLPHLRHQLDRSERLELIK